jgi:hypothetical protein
MKCADDPIYFINTYLFTLRPDQEAMIRSSMANRFVIAKGERQVGKSSTLNALILWTALFRQHQSIALLSFKHNATVLQLGTIKEWHCHLPSWLRQNVLVSRSGHLQFENESRILATSLVSHSTRGCAFSLICMDELAFCPAVDDFFLYVYPSIISSGQVKVAIASTPNGTSKFDKMWQAANYPRDSKDPEKQWNGYEPILMRYA